MNLKEKIEAREATLSVIGLGYVGLPLARVFAEAGFRVIGVDTDTERVASVNRGESYIEDVPSETLARLLPDTARPDGAPALTRGGRGTGSLSATTDYNVLGDIDAVLMCVPTPLSKTKDPDVSYILAATDEVAMRLRPGMLVVLESTTYPGTTEELILPRLEQAGGQQLKAGTDFLLVYSPERIDPGRGNQAIRSTPKVLAGTTPACLDAGKALYGCVVDNLVSVSSPATAEMVKLLENTFRATNVALVNEIAIMCDRLGIDVWEVIDAAGTKPFGFMSFYPGPGLGGHCIPVDPHLLAWKLKTLDYHARFIHLAEEINLGMPLYWVTKVQDALNQIGKAVNGSNVLVIGVTYKPDVADIRESPAIDIIDELLRRGALVSYHDARVPVLETETFRLTSLGDAELDKGLSEADCIVIATDHSTYDWETVRRQASLIVDTRNALGNLPSEPAAAPMAASDD